MPNYDYECETCGPFVENRPMALFDQPCPCPDCGDDAPRLLTVPAIGGMAREDSGGAPAPMAHAGGCACCAAPRRFSADAV
jgi:putative FmdB family regulatory protein